MKKKLMAIVLSVGMGFGVTGMAAANNSCEYEYTVCKLAGEKPAYICDAVYELCLLGIPG